MTDTTPAEIRLDDDSPYARRNGPIDGWFELSYSSYQVVPRTLAQCMPLDWQQRMVTCLRELRQAFLHVPAVTDTEYEVNAGKWVYVNEMTDQQLRVTGTVRAFDQALADAELDEDADDYDEQYRALEEECAGLFYSARGDELRSPARVFVPGAEPLPHYRHAPYIEPGICGTGS